MVDFDFASFALLPFFAWT